MKIIEILNKCNKQIDAANTYEEQREVVKPLIELLEKFINKLNKNDEKKCINFVEEKQYSELLSPNTIISDSILSLVHFNLDDIIIYKEFMEYITDYFVFRKWQEITFNDLIFVIQNFIIQTFGPSGNHSILYGYYCQKEDERISIKDLYNKNLAVCIERTALSHNLLKLLGLNATIITCELSFIKEDSTSFEGHVVNSVRNNDEIYLIDFMNYSRDYATKNDEENVLYVRNVKPTIIKMTNQEYEEFLSNKNSIGFYVIEKYLDKDVEHKTYCKLNSNVLMEKNKKNRLI